MCTLVSYKPLDFCQFFILQYKLELNNFLQIQPLDRKRKLSTETVILKFI